MAEYEIPVIAYYIPYSALRYTAYIGLFSILVLLVLLARLSPNVDRREPSILAPKIPAVGHVTALLREQTRFIQLLSQKTKLPIATLPVLSGKVYAALDPFLVQAAFRNNQLSLLPIATEFAYKQSNLSKETKNVFKTTQLVPDFFAVLHPSLSAKHLRRMNRRAMDSMSAVLDAYVAERDVLKVPNFYYWLRTIITEVTCEALYGPGNVFKNNPTLLEDIWAFEDGMSELASRPFPSLTAAKPWKARARLQEALVKYYGQQLDANEDAAEFVRARANVLRRYGVSDKEIADFEVTLLHVSTANTFPVMFWFATFVFSQPDLVDRLRDEVESVVQRDGHVAKVDVEEVEAKCGLLLRCYKETLRLCMHSFHFRRVLSETTIADGQGNAYLLKEGVDIHMSTYSDHRREDTWGQNAAIFDPDRFLPTEAGSGDKATRAAYHPFGGGRHLCPGRNFATVEILGLMAALLVGWDVYPLGGANTPWKIPGMAKATFADAAAKPERDAEGLGVQMRRREGWEKTKWEYVC